MFMGVRLRRVFAVFVLTNVVSCWAQAPQRPEIKIGFSIETTKGERWQTDLDEFQLRAQQLGAQTITRSAYADDNLQCNQPQDLLDTDRPPLCLPPHNPTQASPMLHA